MIFEEWCQAWNIPPEAQADLRNRFIMHTVDQTERKGNSEAAVQNHDRIEFSRSGGILWRNNCGAGQDDRGNFFRYGIANDSKKVNAIIKSGDCIGIQPILIEPHHLGTTLGQFISREYKAPGWKYRPNNARERAQLAWANLVISMGGDAAFVTGAIK